MRVPDPAGATQIGLGEDAIAGIGPGNVQQAFLFVMAQPSLGQSQAFGGFLDLHRASFRFAVPEEQVRSAKRKHKMSPGAV